MASELTEEELQFVQSLFEHAREGRTGPLTEALDAGVPVNLTNTKGDTLLILAAYHVHLDTVQALLERGADTSRVNDMGQTALAAAVFRQAEPIVTALLEAGADPEEGPKSAVAIAEFFNLPEMAKLLRAR
ncbi:ankyrin repeat domain-containing protein [Rhodococcus sp. X156]|uniref:ankyrin repeat domain-containing protein n=1 Tax=Rhodococcus sp. X156 TaxID=2499145 RepID=UPI000FDA4FE0|nr:ankyrin repeat domain-containing protein [Rhodococcus sp. X156]